MWRRNDVRVRCSGRFGLALASLVALACFATGCSTSRSWSVVAVGDSVPRGANCDCKPYPPLTADDLASRSGRTVKAGNDAVNGATSADVLHQLTSDTAVIDHVRSANAIEIEVGANDVAYSKSCGTAVDCYAGRLPDVEKNLAAIVARARELASGHKLVVVLLDYWSVWLGGKYAAERGPAYVNAAAEMTARVDAIVKATAADSGAHYVDLRAAFKGPDYAYDETHYLSNDGDHPNAAGHVQIAKAVATAVDGARCGDPARGGEGSASEAMSWPRRAGLRDMNQRVLIVRLVAQSASAAVARTGGGGEEN
jgi:acyl-CoA thioesterase I